MTRMKDLFKFLTKENKMSDQPLDENGNPIPTPTIVEATGSAVGAAGQFASEEPANIPAPAPLDITSQPEPHRGILERVKTLLEKDFEAVKAWLEKEENKA